MKPTVQGCIGPADTVFAGNRDVLVVVHTYLNCSEWVHDLPSV